MTTGTLNSTSTSTYVGGGEDARMGNDTSSLIGFYGVAGAAQAAAITQVGTSVPVAACASFGLTSTQLTALVTAVNALIVAVQGVGLTA